MKFTRSNIYNPVAAFVMAVGIIIFIAAIFTSVYYFAISEYISAIWAFLGGLLFFAICSGLSELIYQLLKLRRRIIAINEKSQSKPSDF